MGLPSSAAFVSRANSLSASNEEGRGRTGSEPCFEATSSGEYVRVSEAKRGREKNLETDEDDKARENIDTSSPATAKLKPQGNKDRDRIEKLLVGWGETIWLINVHPGGTGVGKHVGERSVGRAEIVKM